MKNIVSILILILSVLISSESFSQKKAEFPQKKAVFPQKKTPQSLRPTQQTKVDFPQKKAINNKTEYLTDQSGNTYKTVKIGSNVWMAENFKAEQYSNGDKIQEYKEGSGEKGPRYKPYFGVRNDGNHIYSWLTVIDPRGIAPDGWHVPTKADWDELLSNCKSDKDLLSISGWPIVYIRGYYQQLDCPNCKNWNESYRSQVPCHKCKNSRKIQGKYISKESISMNGNNRLKFNIKFVDLEPRNSLIEYWSSQYANSSNSEMYYFYLSFFQNIGYTSTWVSHYDKRGDMLLIRLVKNKPNQDYTEIAKGEASETKIPVVRTKPLYFNNDKKDDTPSKDCSDFPFTLGCVNSKIGDLNASLFMGDRDDNKYTKELQHFLDGTGNFNNTNVNMEITKDMWDRLMNRNVIK